MPHRAPCGPIVARFCFVFSGFEEAVSAPSLRTNYLPLGLESCWGSIVSHACRTEPFADRLWHSFALFLAVSNMPLRHPVLRTNYIPLGLESCWGLAASHACRTEPFADRLWHAFALFLAVSKMPFRRPVSGRITYPLGLNPAGVWLFRMHAAQSPLRTDCGTLLLCFLAVSKMPFRHPICGRITYRFVFGGFEPAASAPSLRTNYLPLGLESCWGLAACRTEPFADRL